MKYNAAIGDLNANYNRLQCIVAPNGLFLSFLSRTRWTNVMFEKKVNLAHFFG